VWCIKTKGQVGVWKWRQLNEVCRTRTNVEHFLLDQRAALSGRCGNGLLLARRRSGGLPDLDRGRNDFRSLQRRLLPGVIDQNQRCALGHARQRLPDGRERRAQLAGE
jgi:hypothetical protein